MVSTVVRLAAFSLLMAMLLLMLGSVREDALTYDEPAHIAAGYAYLRFQDARLNPEHPPLLKMLAAAPLLMLKPHFPLTSPAWQDAVNGQETADLLLYKAGNDPHRITALARLVPMVFTVCLGAVLFVWTRRFAGALAAVLALFAYTCSPTLLAHGRLVTTDVAAAAGVTLAGFAFIRFLHRPTSRVALIAGLALGAALLCKFSTILLVPLFAVLVLLWTVLTPVRRSRYLSGAVIITLSAAFLLLLPAGSV